VARGKRRAGAAIALLRLGLREDVFGALRVGKDPESLTQFVHRCRERGVTTVELLDCLHLADALRQTKSGEDRSIEDRVLFGLLLALGEFQLDDMHESERAKLVLQLVDWYANDPSSAIHGATGWLLRHWGLTEQARTVDQTPVAYEEDREWFTLEIKLSANQPGSTSEIQPTQQPLYMTFVVFGAGEYTFGSEETEPGRLKNEIRHIAKITRPFAILDREITRAECTASGLPLSGGRSDPTPDHPAGGPNWFDAVNFCHWLTTKCGLSDEHADQRLDIADNDPRGFRLPSEHEWEIACRAGMRTTYCMGSDVQLLNHYAWLMTNTDGGQLPRTVRPNARGLFDLHGNVWEWCSDWYAAYPTTLPLDPNGPADGDLRVNRGGSWGNNSTDCRSAYRGGDEPANRVAITGFRLAISLDLFGQH
jgi:formylglycine-generating enzyme required for sulfatase activity